MQGVLVLVHGLLLEDSPTRHVWEDQEGIIILNLINDKAVDVSIIRDLEA